MMTPHARARGQAASALRSSAPASVLPHRRVRVAALALAAGLSLSLAACAQLAGSLTPASPLGAQDTAAAHAPLLVRDGAFSPAEAVESVASPDGRTVVEVFASGGAPRYRVIRDGDEIIASSALGLRFAVAANLDADLALDRIARAARDDTWEQPWGERRRVRDVHAEMAAVFTHADSGADAFTLRVRVFDDGLGFRYEAPAPAGQARALVDEITEFRLDPDAASWWTPANGWNRYEELTRSTPVSKVTVAHTPFTARLNTGVHVAIHEAALIDYAGMSLNQRRAGVLRADLSPRSDGVKVRSSGALITPWRTIQIADAAVGLINSDLILNLNAPNALGDVSWVEPGRYVGIWWCMHIDACTWGSGDRHGATTERTKAYIDFAAEHGFAGVLVEGWNEGWDGDWFSNGDVFSFTEPYSDFDLEGLAAYARARGVRLIGHHETSGSLANYEAQMEDAYDLYQRLGVAQIKTGYVADGGGLTRRDAAGERRFEWHDNQHAVNHHALVLKRAAAHQLAINAHEPVKDTGLRRTYPNALSREGARGQEYNAWSQPPNPPEHVPLLAFTRMLGGPMDFTPGIVDIDISRGNDAPVRVQTTLAKQLALYVVLYSPVQMAADLPDNYRARPDALSFITDVPVDWESSRALMGEVGDYVVTARQERIRGAQPDASGGRWFLGAVTDEEARTLDVALDFLSPGVTYAAQIWRDADDADWRTNPEALARDTATVTAGDVLTVTMAPGGGYAAAFTPVTQSPETVTQP